MVDDKNNYLLLPVIKDSKKLAEYYSLADCFVICSKRENFPTTCIEAQCCGTPIVGFDAGGAKETSVLGDNYFVQYGDIDALVDKINRILDLNVSEISNCARKKFSKETMTNKYIHLYDQSGRKERVLLIDVNCKFSSTGKIVYDLYQYLKSVGREVAVCYGRGEQIKEENVYKFGIDFETYLHAALSRISGYNGCFSLISTMRLINYMEKFQPDLIHIHELHAYFVNINILMSYIKRKKIPVVWTFHCEYMYTGKCGHAYECQRYKSGCGDCPAVQQYPKSLFFDKTKQMFEWKKRLLEDLDFVIVTPSEWLKQRVQTSFLNNKRVEVIHNGIDTEVFSPQNSEKLRKELGVSIEKKIVLAVAPDILSDNKGGRQVIELAKKMGENFFFILVGVKGEIN